MRFNVAYAILLGFAVLELLLLQAAVFVDGYAHAITKPAVLPTESAGGGVLLRRGGILSTHPTSVVDCDARGHCECGGNLVGERIKLRWTPKLSIELSIELSIKLSIKLRRTCEQRGPNLAYSRATGPAQTDATPTPSNDSDNGSSGSDTGKKVGIAMGIISGCILAAAGAWFAYRRHLDARRNHQNAPWQAPSAGPYHHHPDAVELDAVGAARVEIDHSPAPPRSEMDASPRPSELGSREPSHELASPPVSPLPLGDGGVPIGGSRSPVSPLVESESPVSEAAAPVARGPPGQANNFYGRYGPGGFLNPEYALRDGLHPDEDDRQVAENKP
ncbi:hypothetical protein SLS58_008947 [Diplodia intermedia]|uniref:Uncharacterized protein n=1 Tax=Diplodia intermedia TaxID=856260 RepID=A0ABR3TF13_9PEZI